MFFRPVALASRYIDYYSRLHLHIPCGVKIIMLQDRRPAYSYCVVLCSSHPLIFSVLTALSLWRLIYQRYQGLVYVAFHSALPILVE